MSSTNRVKFWKTAEGAREYAHKLGWEEETIDQYRQRQIFYRITQNNKIKPTT